MARDSEAEELHRINDLWLPRREDAHQPVDTDRDDEPDRLAPHRAGVAPAVPDQAPAVPDQTPAAPDDASRVSSSGDPVLSLTAAAFTDERMLAPRRLVPQRGWQKALYESTSGRMNPGPGRAERRERELLGRCRAVIHGSRRVVVMSRKGGVGKTTVALALGSTFAMVRGDRVVAVDANPDAGNLAHRVAEPADLTITDVLADIENINSYADLRRYTTQNLSSRLEVLASDDDARIGQALSRDAYHRVISLLDRYYNLIMLDTGTGILDSANQGLLTEADQLVLVLRPALDGARAAALTLDWLVEHDYGDLVRQAVVVINAVRPGLGVSLDVVEDHFTRRCAHVLQVPWDKALETGGQTDMARLRHATRHALTEVAAAVADNFRKGTPARAWERIRKDAQ
ncbi:MAG TPA: AAA family ATPase [Actinomycetales bacterium]|nr:AAA family ATPase [Actinomycetales bacterium]